MTFIIGDHWARLCSKNIPECCTAAGIIGLNAEDGATWDRVKMLINDTDFTEAKWAVIFPLGDSLVESRTIGFASGKERQFWVPRAMPGIARAHAEIVDINDALCVRYPGTKFIWVNPLFLDFKRFWDDLVFSVDRVEDLSTDEYVELRRVFAENDPQQNNETINKLIHFNFDKPGAWHPLPNGVVIFTLMSAVIGRTGPILDLIRGRDTGRIPYRISKDGFTPTSEFWKQFWGALHHEYHRCAMPQVATVGAMALPVVAGSPGVVIDRKVVWEGPKRSVCNYTRACRRDHSASDLIWLESKDKINKFCLTVELTDIDLEKYLNDIMQTRHKRVIFEHFDGRVLFTESYIYVQEEKEDKNVVWSAPREYFSCRVVTNA